MRLHNILEQYLADIEQAVDAMSVYVERYSEEILTDVRANLRLRLRFADGHLLEVNEAVIVEHEQLKWSGYRYHFQGRENHLIFRYDDTPHFPNLATFPHHKHWYDDVLASPKPDLLAVLDEAQRLAEGSK